MLVWAWILALVVILYFGLLFLSTDTEKVSTNEHHVQEGAWFSAKTSKQATNDVATVEEVNIDQPTNTLSENESDNEPAILISKIQELFNKKDFLNKQQAQINRKERELYRIESVLNRKESELDGIEFDLNYRLSNLTGELEKLDDLQIQLQRKWKKLNRLNDSSEEQKNKIHQEWDDLNSEWTRLNNKKEEITQRKIELQMQRNTLETGRKYLQAEWNLIQEEWKIFYEKDNYLNQELNVLYQEYKNLDQKINSLDDMEQDFDEIYWEEEEYEQNDKKEYGFDLISFIEQLRRKEKQELHFADGLFRENGKIINPASGLPMVGPLLDAGGNLYGDSDYTDTKNSFYAINRGNMDQFVENEDYIYENSNANYPIKEREECSEDDNEYS